MEESSVLPFPVVGEISEGAWDQVAEGQPVLLLRTGGPLRSSWTRIAGKKLSSLLRRVHDARSRRPVPALFALAHDYQGDCLPCRRRAWTCFGQLELTVVTIVANAAGEAGSTSTIQPTYDDAQCSTDRDDQAVRVGAQAQPPTVRS
jgi:hypothetical protein